MKNFKDIFRLLMLVAISCTFLGISVQNVVASQYEVVSGEDPNIVTIKNEFGTRSYSYDADKKQWKDDNKAFPHYLNSSSQDSVLGIINKERNKRLAQVDMNFKTANLPVGWSVTGEGLANSSTKLNMPFNNNGDNFQSLDDCQKSCTAEHHKCVLSTGMKTYTCIEYKPTVTSSGQRQPDSIITGCTGNYGLFGGLITTGKKIFEGLRDLIYVVAGFGIIGVAVGGFFGNLNWKWLGAIVIALVVIASTGELIVAITGCQEFTQGLITDTLK